MSRRSSGTPGIAMLKTIFALETAEVTLAQWRQVADA
jgi:hypothetical protein